MGGAQPWQVELLGVPGLTALDVADPQLPDGMRDELLARLTAMHLQFFAPHAHVPGEWCQGFRDGWPDSQVVVHLWLLQYGGRDVGEVILHTNLRRGVVLVHFVAIDAQTRHSLPHHWLDSLSDAFVACGLRDAGEAGVPLRAVAGEIPEAHLHKWARTGFRPVTAHYQEPRYGMHWREHGAEPEFFDMLGIIRVVAEDDGLADDEVPTSPDGAAVRGFLLDHYHLDPTHPRVARMLADADAGTGRPPAGT